MTDITYMTAVMLSAMNGANIECKRKGDSERHWSYVLRPTWNWMDLDYRVAQWGESQEQPSNLTS